LAYQVTVLIENRHDLALRTCMSPTTGTAERENAVLLAAVAPYRAPHITVGADKGLDTRGCVDELRAVRSTPHLARNDTVRHQSAIDVRTTRHPGYAAPPLLRSQNSLSPD